MMAYSNNSTRLLPNVTTEFEDPTASPSSGEDGTLKVWFKPTTSLNPVALQHWY